jgi:hypothetical protein
VRLALRWCVFVKRPQPYLLVYDDIQKDEAEHDYDFLLHTPTPTGVSLDQGIRMTLDVEGRRATCDVVMLNPETIAIGQEMFTCPGHRPFDMHTLWRLKRRAINPQFVVLLVPGGVAGPPACRVEVDQAAQALTVIVRFDSGHVDHIVLPRDPRPQTKPSPDGD